MDLYGVRAASWPQKIWIIACELALILLSTEILFGTWGSAFAHWMGWSSAHQSVRNAIVFTFSIVVFLRMTYMMIALLHRHIPLDEAISVPLAFAAYFIGFPLLTLRSDRAIGAPAIVGIVLFVVGSFLNSAAEVQRARWKQRPENAGHLYTRGLFAWSMHINYFGDILWVTGYALVSGNPWSALVPVGLFCFFAFYNVPKLDKYLRQRYGLELDAYARRTARLIPLIF